MRKESATIRRCHSQLSALGLDSDAVFHRSKLILKIYRDVVWVLSERVEELQEYAWDLGKQDIDTGLCYLENFAPDIDLQDFEEKVCCVVESRMFVEIIDRALLRLRKYPWNAAFSMTAKRRPSISFLSVYLDMLFQRCRKSCPD